MAYYNIGDSFRWFMARAVELDPKDDPKDKRYLGRVKIRILHEQTGELGKKKKTFGLKDDDLLWAWPLNNIQSASLSYRKIVELEEFNTPFWIDAVGTSPTGIAVGTYCFGFFLDGHERNIPIIWATYAKSSIYPEPPTDEPTGKMLQIKPPEEDYPYMDVSALAKGWWEDTKRELNHPLGQDYPLSTDPGKGGQLLPKHPYNKGLMNLVWQPASDYATEYPYNTVTTTKSGHAIELDDTPGHERIHWWHRSGSYEEISNNEDGLPQWRDALPGKYPDTMRGWLEPQKDHKSGLHPPWEGRRVKKTVGNDYTISLENKETFVGASQKLEVANNTTIGIGNNHIETVANNVYIAVGYYPRTANNQLAGESARYQLIDPWINETSYRKNADKKIKQLPDTHKYDFITDVANNVQLTVGWSWKKARELDTHSEKNNYIEIANNQLTSIGWIPLNNEDGDGEARQLADIEKTNYYLDVKNNGLLNIGWNPQKNTDQIRTISETDSTNYYIDVKNNTVQTYKNNMALSIGYDKSQERGLKDTDQSTYYRDVRNNTHIRTNNNYNLNVGLSIENENKLTDDDFGNYYVKVAGNAKHVSGFDTTMLAKGTFFAQGFETNLRSQTGMVIESGGGLWINAGNGITIGNSVTLIGKTNLTAYLTAKNGASGSWTTADGKKITVTAGIITDIS